jgi:1-acyl-sn-glycerol-3-phosphate acyltransferase
MEPGPQSLLIVAAVIASSVCLWWAAGKARSRGHDDVVVGILAWIATPLVRGLWRADFRGPEKLPHLEPGQGMVIVSNHTSGLDPVLIQHLMPFKIRWLMSREMMISALGFLWRRLRVIPIDFNGQDRAAVREALSGLAKGDVIGIFPEGGIARPPKMIHPFLPGVGFIVAKAAVPVVVVHVSGITPARTAYGALFRRCHARIEIVEVVRFPKGAKSKEITESLQERLQRASGWPLHVAAPSDPTDDPVVPSEAP